MKRLILIIPFFILGNLAFAYSPLWMGFGSVTHNFKSAQTGTSGTSTKSFEFAPTFLIGGTLPFPLLSNTYFTPGFGFVKYANGKDGSTKSEIILKYQLNYAYSSWLALRYGFSNYITHIGGSGGSTSLNNGTSTKTFYLPSKTVSSYTASIDLGPEFILSSVWTIRVQLSIERFLSSERRTLAHLITANYFF